MRAKHVPWWFQLAQGCAETPTAALLDFLPTCYYPLSVEFTFPAAVPSSRGRLTSLSWLMAAPATDHYDLEVCTLLALTTTTARTTTPSATSPCTYVCVLEDTAIATFVCTWVAHRTALASTRTCERSRDLAERMRELSADVYTVPAEFEGLERPPSYTEIVKIDNMVYGVPPPDYSAVGQPTDLEAPSLPPRRTTLPALVWQAASRRTRADECSVAHGDCGGAT